MELLDAIGQVGEAADKFTGGRALRGVLAGKPREALSVLPWSDSMGLTNEHDRTSGRDLTDAYGVTQKGDESFGSHALGFGAEMLANPFGLAGAWGAAKAAPTLGKGVIAGAKSLSGLDLLDHLGSGTKAAGRFIGDEGAALHIPRAPYAPEDVASLTGKAASRITPDAANAAYGDWAGSLRPEEAAAIRHYTGWNQPRISQALRGPKKLSDGSLYDHFAGGTLNDALRSPEDVLSKVVPNIDSALGRTASPQDMLAYRLAGQIGDMRPDNAASFVGRTISDPGYLSTTIDPWGRFYGQQASPHNLLADILVPKGARAGYVDPLSGFKQEKELLLPRNSQFQVKHVQDVPVQKIDHDWYRLDAAGKPIPKTGNFGSRPFVENAGDKWAEITANGGMHGGNAVVPDELMRPDWREFVRSNLQSEGTQKNALLEFLGNDTGSLHVNPNQIPIHQQMALRDIAGTAKDYVRAREAQRTPLGNLLRSGPTTPGAAVSEMGGANPRDLLAALGASGGLGYLAYQGLQ